MRNRAEDIPVVQQVNGRRSGWCPASRRSSRDAQDAPRFEPNARMKEYGTSDTQQIMTQTFMLFS